MIGDLFAFAFSFAYVVFVIVLSKYLKNRGVSPKILRELTHMSMGVWPILWFLFNDRLWATSVPFIVTVLLALAPKSIRSTFSEGEEKHVGLVFYAFSFTVITFFFFKRFEGAAAIFSLAFGDGLGGLLGSRYGKLKYKIPWVKVKTLEGSLTIFVMSVVSIIFAHYLFSSGFVDPTVALIGGLLAMIIEAVSPYHSDNLTIPLILAPLLSLL